MLLKEKLLKAFKEYLKEESSNLEGVANSVKISGNFLEYLKDKDLSLEMFTVKEAKDYLEVVKSLYNFKYSSLDKVRSNLSKFFSFLIEKEIVQENVFDVKHFRKVKPFKDFNLTDEQTKELEKYLKHKQLLEGKSRYDNSNLNVIKKYLSFLNEYKIDYLKAKIADIEMYLSHLLTLKSEDGKTFYSANGVNGILKVLNNFYNYLLKKGRVFYNPFKNLKRPKQNKSLPRNILEEEKLFKLLALLKKEVLKAKDLFAKRKAYLCHVIAELMYSTGARINEVVKLKATDFDLVKGLVKLKDDKTKKERIGFLNSYAVEVLQEFLKVRPLLAYSHSVKDLLFFGKQNTARTFNQEVCRVSESHGLGKFVSHNLRHTFGFHMLRAGCDIRFIQSFLGHESLHTTEIYTRIDKSDLKKVLDKYHPRVMRSVT